MIQKMINLNFNPFKGSLGMFRSKLSVEVEKVYICVLIEI